MEALLRLIRRGFCRGAALERAAPRVVRGRAGERLAGAARVRARHEDGLPAARAVLRFFVVKGDAVLNGAGREARARTDASGLAGVDVTLASRGYALIGAELAGDPARSVYFDARTDAVSDRVHVYAEPCIPVERGAIEVTIGVTDFEGRPVSGADLALEAHAGFEPARRGRVWETAPGRYRGTIETTRAGAYTIVAQDRRTFAKGAAALHVLPSPPERFEFVGKTDPRAAAPFDRVDLRVRLVDRFGNALPPHRVRAFAGEAREEMVGALAGDTAVFQVRAAGYVHVPVRLQDAQGELAQSYIVDFAACWLADPGLVRVGTTYRTALYATPPPDRAAEHATVTIDFDPALVAFKGYEPSPGATGLSCESRVEGATAVLDFRAETAVEASRHPEGFFLGYVRWECLGEGRTCFGLVGRMSPSTPKWELCVEQKRELDSCVCVNLIYPEGDEAALDKGKQAVEQLTSVIGSADNLSRCCPVLSVRTRTCAIPQARLREKIGADGKVTTDNEWLALGAGSYCIEVGCMNLFMVPVEMPGETPTSTKRGESAVGPMGSGQDTYGFGVLDPEVVGEAENVGAHELAHQLGLEHVDDPDRLMHEKFTDDQGYGARLTQGECRTIFQTLGRYPC